MTPNPYNEDHLVDVPRQAPWPIGVNQVGR